MKAKITDLLYSFAAAIVVFGAWAKIEHLYFADIALTAGLLTEVGIFLLYGILALTGTGISPAETPPAQTQLNGVEAAVKETNGILRSVFNTVK